MPRRIPSFRGAALGYGRISSGYVGVDAAVDVQGCRAPACRVIGATSYVFKSAGFAGRLPEFRGRGEGGGGGGGEGERERDTNIPIRNELVDRQEVVIQHLK